jgi:hypothetical protein
MTSTIGSRNSQDNEPVGVSYYYSSDAPIEDGHYYDANNIRLLSADDIAAGRENTERNRRERAADPPQQDDSGDTELYEMPDEEVCPCGRSIPVQSEQAYIDCTSSV